MKISVKLTIIIMLITLLALGIAAVFYEIRAEAALNDQVLNQLESVASIQKSRIESILDQNLERLGLVASRTQLRVSLREYNADPQPEHQNRMNGIMEDARDSVSDFKDISIANLDGQIVASTNPAYIGADRVNEEFFIVGQSDSRVDLLFLDENGNLNVYLTGPLYLDDELLGVIVIEATVDNIISAVTDYTGLGETGETFLVDFNEAGDALFLTPLRFDEEAALRKTISGENTGNVAVQALQDNPETSTELTDYRAETVFAATRVLPDTDWGLAVKIDKNEALAPVIQLRNSLLVVSFGVFVLVVLAAIFFGRSITSPIVKLTEVAQKIRQGDFSTRAESTSQDEMGILAQTFNQMTDQLQDLVGSLEDRVTARTERLEVLATLSERLSAILDFDQLLSEMIDQVKTHFNYYHAHVYIIDDSRKNLVMTAGAGEAGRQMKAKGHSIPLNASTSLVARAARTGQVVRVDNVREAPDWLPNPLLPDTYSEMAVPIILEDQVVGVLDVQEDEIAGLDEGDASLLRSLANQVAVAIRNAQQFEQMQAALEEARVVQQQYLEGAWSRDLVTRRNVGRVQFSVGESTTLDEAAIRQAREFAQQVGALTPVTLHDGAEQTEADSPQHALVAPLKLRDVTIGSLQFHDVGPTQRWSDSQAALINAVIDQVVQTAENLRLFEETRERARREQLIGQIGDKLQRAPDFETLIKTGVEELARVLGPSRTFVKLGSESELLQAAAPPSSAEEPLESDGESSPDAGDGPAAIITNSQPTTNGRGDKYE